MTLAIDDEKSALNTLATQLMLIVENNGLTNLDGFAARVDELLL